VVIDARQMAVLVFFGVFCGKKSVNSHTGGAMAKPVAVFRSGVIGDSRHMIPSGSMKTATWCYFPLSAGLSPHGRYQISATWPVEASRSRYYRPGSGIWLVVGWLPCS
jgi:hypothetical protein